MRSFIFLAVGSLNLISAQLTEVLKVGRLVQVAHQMYQLYAERNIDKKQKVDSTIKLIKDRLQMLEPDGLAKAIESIRQFLPSDSLCKQSMESFIEFLHLTKSDKNGYITLSDSLLK